ncbi:MAG: PAS domain S-box protein, partial [Candidatus Eisenbacteria bacterium]|nr:PAS domain S-box protein [Candidatus Eisenbacteria bacterium]
MMFHRGSPDHRPLSELEILRRRVKELEAAAQKHQDVETLQRSLHECQEKLKSTFDASPDAIIITDLDGDITECNKAMVSILGLNTKEAVIGRHFSTLVVPSDRPHARQKFLEVIQNGTSREVEVSLDVAGNRQIPVLTAGSLIFDSKGVPASVIICAKDISQRKALEEENIRLATAIEQADEMVLVADHQGAICYANPAFEKVTG